MRARRILRAIPLLLIATAVAAGCGSDDSDDGGSSKQDDGGSKVTTPAPLEAGGEFVVCTDVPYPPAESLEGSTYVGYEIDLMTEVADRLGTEATFEKTLFDAIIPALQSKKCDAIISSMNVTPEREKEVAFVPYMAVGQSLMVAKGEGEGIENLDDLAGKDVAVQVGTTLKDALSAKSKELTAAGKDPIDIQTFPDAGAAAAALKTDKVDVFFGDSPVVADYVVKDGESFEFAGEPIDPIEVGIALRTGDSDLQKAVQDAVDEMYEDGTMVDILSRWNVEDFVLASEG
jgi:polar amino acid transport system substrate-binding protein